MTFLFVASLLGLVSGKNRRSISKSSHTGVALRRGPEICFSGGDTIPAAEGKEGLKAILTRQFTEYCSRTPFTLNGNAPTEYEKTVATIDGDSQNCKVVRGGDAKSYYHTCVKFALAAIQHKKYYITHFKKLVDESLEMKTCFPGTECYKRKDREYLANQYDRRLATLTSYRENEMLYTSGLPVSHACSAYIHWATTSEWQGNGMAHTRAASGLGDEATIRDAAFVANAASDIIWNFCLLKHECNSAKTFEQISTEGITYQGKANCN